MRRLKSVSYTHLDVYKRQTAFKPDIYSPHFSLVMDQLLDYCKKNKIKLIPWTVNEEADILRLIQLGVDGIISDYPDKVIELYEGSGYKSNKE